MKKILLGLGTVTAVVTPAVTVISCSKGVEPNVDHEAYYIKLDNIKPFLAMKAEDKIDYLVDEVSAAVHDEFMLIKPQHIDGKIQIKLAVDIYKTVATFDVYSKDVESLRWTKDRERSKTILKDVITEGLVNKISEAMKKI